MPWRLLPTNMLADVSPHYRFKIEDAAPRLAISRDPFACWACIRLDRLRTGYRFIHLKDPKGSPTRGVLLVRIEKELHGPAADIDGSKAGRV